MLIRTKLLINTIIITVITITTTAFVIGFIAIDKSKKSLLEEVTNRLLFLNKINQNQISNYFDDLQQDLLSFAKNKTSIDSLNGFTNAFINYDKESAVINMQYEKNKLDSFVRDYAKLYAYYNNGKIFNMSSLFNRTNQSAFALQYNYTISSPFIITEKNKLETLKDNTAYDINHLAYHKYMQDYVNSNDNISDLLLVNADGIVVYSVMKELDFTTSLISGPFAKYELGKIFQMCMELPEQKTVISDFAPNIASYGLHYSFAGVPIFDQMKKKIGVIIFKISLDNINNIMNADNKWQDVGLGLTGESYIVGPDRTLRNITRKYIENKNNYLNILEQQGALNIEKIKSQGHIVGLQDIDTFGANSALHGESGIGNYKNYLGQDVIGVYNPINMLGLNWVMLCEMEQQEIFMIIDDLKSKIYLIIAPLIFSMCLLASIIMSGTVSIVTRRIKNFAKYIQKITLSNDLTQRFVVDQKDELSIISEALNNFFEKVQKVFQNTSYLIDEAKHNNYKNSDVDLYNDSLSELSTRLEELSDEFKFFEMKADSTKEWQ